MPLFEFKEVPRISVLSTTYVRCTVSATEAGVPANPTDGTVSFAFLPDDAVPVSGDWKAGSWAAPGNGEYWGRCLVGPAGTVTLAAGTYDVWIRLTRGLENVIDQVGKLTIY